MAVTWGKFTAIVGTEKYKEVHGFGETTADAIEDCINKILKKSDAAGPDEVIVGFWTPTGVIAKPMNMWMRHTHPT